MKNIFSGLFVLAAIFACAICEPARAANCSTYPYTLTNGQTADATQVMANFNTIMSCANANLAHNGSNSDITSLSGLATPLSPSQGGTGATSLFAAGIAGNGANTDITSLSSVSLLGTTSAATLNTSGNLAVGGTLAVTGSTTVAGLTASGKIVTPATATGSAGLILPPGTAPTSPVNGDIWTTSTGLFVQINGQTLTSIGVGQIVEVTNTQTSGTDNPDTAAFTTSAWNPKVLNTVALNGITGASLSGNRITLPAGTYKLTATGSSFLTSSSGAWLCQKRIFNYTTTAFVRSLNETANSPMVPANMGIQATFTLTASNALGFDMYCTGSPQNIGRAMSLGPEVYTDVIVQKIG